MMWPLWICWCRYPHFYSEWICVCACVCVFVVGGGGGGGGGSITTYISIFVSRDGCILKMNGFSFWCMWFNVSMSQCLPLMEARIFHLNYVNAVTAVDLAFCIAISSPYFLICWIRVPIGKCSHVSGKQSIVQMFQFSFLFQLSGNHCPVSHLLW